MADRFKRDENRTGGRRSSAKLLRRWIALSPVVVGAACNPTPQVNPFVVPPQEFYQNIQTIVATPITLPEGVSASDSVLTWFEDLIEDALRRAGFTVVPVQTYADIWRQITEEAGGFYDPYTGQRDEQRYEVGVDELFAELKQRFNPDAILYPEIWTGEAPTSGGYARWDGAKQEVGTSAESVVLALSLVIVLQDMDGTELYSNGWGLEVLETYHRATRDFELVPSEDLFADQERNATAVLMALGPLIDRTAQSEDTVPSSVPRPLLP